MKPLLLALALVAGASGIAIADGIFPDCHGEGECNSFCSNMSSSPGCGCDTRSASRGETLSVGTSLALIGLAAFWATKKRRR